MKKLLLLALFLLPSIADAAIAHDAVSTGQASATTVTATHTTSGSNRILYCGAWIQDGGADRMTGITYNGVAMTQVNKYVSVGGIESSIYLYQLIAPDTGSNTVTMTKTGTDLGYVICSSYTGARQTSQPDASTTNNGGPIPSLTTSVTVNTANSWTLLMLKATDTGISAGSGTTLRTDGPNNDQTGMYDSNGAVGTGSRSLETTKDGGANTFMAHLMVSIAPAADAVAPTPLGGLIRSFWW